MAAACHVSKSSVSRFCQELGYDGFSRFRTDVLRYRRQNHFKYELGEQDVCDPHATLFANYCSSVACNVEQLSQQVDDAQIARLACEINDYDQVVVAGEMQSGDIACAFQHNLFEAGKVVRSLVTTSQLSQVQGSVAPGSLLIVFSLFGHLFRRLDEGAVPWHKPHGSKVWLITSNLAGAVPSAVDEIIDCGLGKNLAAGNLAMELIANGVVMHYWQLRHARTCE